MARVFAGVDEPEDVVKLAKSVGLHDTLHFAGIHAYQGKAQHIRSKQERREIGAVATGIPL
jgi:3-hydroxy-D-aspartate aldolase